MRRDKNRNVYLNGKSIEKPAVTDELVHDLLDTKFLKVFGLEYISGRNYMNASRRIRDNLVVLKSEEEFKEMLPDAVSCFVIMKEKGKEAKLLLFYEFRYPTGQFLLSPPAGLMDPVDCKEEQPLLATAKREIYEETGIEITERDRLEVVNPLLFSSPGMTDESNGIVLAVIEREDLSSLTQEHAEGTECFDGFKLLTKSEAKEILKAGRDEYGIFYSVYTWAALCYFVSDMWII